MKTTRIIALFLAALMLLTLVSCKPSKPIHDPLLGEGYNETGDPDDGYHASDRLRVCLFRNYGSEKALEQINDVLRKADFNLEFTAFTEPNADAFGDYIRQNIDTNTVFVVNRYIMSGSGYNSYDMDFYNMIEKLREENLLGDFYGYGTLYAPEYMRNPLVESFNDPGTLTLMPTRFETTPLDALAVIVREDIADAYGGEIRTASDYYNLLSWIKRNDPNVTPGMMITNAIVYPIYDLLLPEAGYWNVNGKLIGKIGESGAALAFTLPEAYEAIEDMARWRREGLLYFMDTTSYFFTPSVNRPRFEDCPTILLNFSDFAKSDEGILKMAGFNNFDASGYRIYTLYNGVLPTFKNFAGKNYADSPAIAGNTDVSEFLRFLEWLGNRENYDLLFNGVEGVDYALRGGRLVPLEDSERDREGILAFLGCFRRGEFKDIPPFAPHNFEKELQAWSWAYTIEGRQEDFDAWNSWFINLSALESMYIVGSNMGDVSNDIFYSAFAPDAERVKALIDKSLERINEYMYLYQEEAAFFEEIFKNATIRYDWPAANCHTNEKFTLLTYWRFV